VRIERLTTARAAIVVSLVCLLIAALVLSALISIWFLIPVPVLAAAVFAALLGMTPSRFADALDDSGTGTGSVFPF
jgi:cobalamin synthase